MEKWLRVHILGLSICVLTMYVLVSTFIDFILVWNKLEWCYVQAISTLFSGVTIQNACQCFIFIIFLVTFRLRLVRGMVIPLGKGIAISGNKR
jgi:hypothetical protein